MCYDYQIMQQRQYQQAMEDQREIAKAEAKAAAVESVKFQSRIAKGRLKEQIKERERSVFEELLITDAGEIQVVTRNLSIEARPRLVTNMSEARLTVLSRLEKPEEQIYRVNCLVGKTRKDIFLEAEMAGKSSYLMRKLASTGIHFLVSPEKAKVFALQLLCVLLENSAESEFVPDRTGWIKFPDGGFRFVEKEGLTWEKAKNLCR